MPQTAQRRKPAAAPSHNGNGHPKPVEEGLAINDLEDVNRMARDENAARQAKQVRNRQNLLDRMSALSLNLSTNPFSRDSFFRSLIDGNRDIDGECGYPIWLTPDNYKQMYNREGIAARVVHCEPEETWVMDPEVYEDEDESTETEFEEAWEDLLDIHNVWHYLQRADILSGIGQYGLMLIGIDDGKDLAEPVDGVNDDGSFDPPAKGKGNKLLYLSVFDESVLMVKQIVKDTTSPRFGKPELYQIIFRDYPNWGTQATQQISRTVHWTRVIHVADNRLMSETYGTPRQQNVYNRLHDVRKILASSGEGYWKSAFPGLAFEVNPAVAEQGIELDAESIRKEMEAYQSGLQRYLALTGVTAKTLPPAMIEPTNTVEAHLKAIAVSKNIPYRILFGSEEAKLASNEDSRKWNKRLAARQQKYVTPMLINPFIDRLIAMGVLPDPADGYSVDWPDLSAPTDKDKADIALVKSQAMAQYVSSGANQLMAPREFFTMVLGMTGEEADMVLDAAAEYGNDQIDESGIGGGLMDSVQDPAAQDGSDDVTGDAASDTPNLDGSTTGAKAKRVQGGFASNKRRHVAGRKGKAAA